MVDTITLEDGMLVTRTPITLANGSTATHVSIPIVTSARVDTTDPANSAQIKVGLNQISLPLGFGLNAITSDLQTVANSAAAIKAAIDAGPITHTTAENAYLTSYTHKYLSTLAADSQVNVTTFAPITGVQAPTAPLDVYFSGKIDAMVLDLSQTALGSTVRATASFTAVLGAGTVNMVGAGQFAIGDDANQDFISPMRGGTVYAGGGDDSMSFGFGMARIDTLFHGGQGFDTLKLGSFSIIEQHAGYVIINGGHNVQLKLVNVERIEMNGQVIDITATTEQSAIATLYQNILGRQADLTGFEYWDNQVKAGQSLGQVAITMTRSTESGNSLFNGNTSHDLDTLYNVILKRPTDPVGKTYWSAQIDQGLQSLEQVAQGFVTSN